MSAAPAAPLGPVALGLNGLAVFAGASIGPLAAQLPIGFSGLLLMFASLVMAPLAWSGSTVDETAEVTV